MKSSPLKILQIGAGSMGTRRMRDLHRRADVALALYDQRPDRRSAAQTRFGVEVFPRLEEALAWDPGALIISTPPGAKGAYIDLAFERGLHHFSEADIWTYGAARRRARAKGIVGVPSASIKFLPIVKGLEELVRGRLGSLLTYHLALGTYMPNWHVREGNEYYGRHRDTAPAREMVCFELTWLNPIFGAAVEVAGRFEKFGKLPGKTEDTWTLLMRLKNGGMGQLSSTMACPKEYLRGCCFGSNGFATWDIQSGEVMLRTNRGRAAQLYQFGATGAVLEATYSEEINSFVDAALGKKAWVHSYALSQESVATLAAAEKSSVSGRWVKVDPEAEPEPSPPFHRR